MTKLTFTLTNESDTQQLAARLAQVLEEPCVIFLRGELGAGKTSLVRYLLRCLGYQHKVKSPTYTLIESYFLSNKTIHHCDFYRLDNAKSLDEIGIAEYFTENAICFIEWPKFSDVLPQADLDCYLQMQDQKRVIQLKGVSERGKKIISFL